MDEYGRIFKELSLSPTLLQAVTGKTPYKHLNESDQILLCTIVFDRLGNFFQGNKVYFHNQETLQETMRRWDPLFKKCRTNAMLRTVNYICSGKCGDWLKYAPNPNEFLDALKKSQRHYAYHELAKLEDLIPLPGPAPKDEGPRTIADLHIGIIKRLCDRAMSDHKLDVVQKRAHLHTAWKSKSEMREFYEQEARRHHKPFEGVEAYLTSVFDLNDRLQSRTAGDYLIAEYQKLPEN